jgi:hypothetical protein
MALCIKSTLHFLQHFVGAPIFSYYSTYIGKLSPLGSTKIIISFSTITFSVLPILKELFPFILYGFRYIIYIFLAPRLVDFLIIWMSHVIYAAVKLYFLFLTRFFPVQLFSFSPIHLFFLSSSVVRQFFLSLLSRCSFFCTFSFPSCYSYCWVLPLKLFFQYSFLQMSILFFLYRYRLHLKRFFSTFCCHCFFILNSAYNIFLSLQFCFVTEFFFILF